MIGAATVIAVELANDPVITALATGGVWDRPLARDGWRATPAAYDDRKQLKPAIVVTDNGDTDDPQGLSGTRMGFVQLWLHAANTDPGRNALTALAALLAAKYRARVVPGIGDAGADVTYVDRLGLTDDPGDDKQVLDYLRLQVSGLEGGMD